MTCAKIRRLLPGYLDGALRGTQHVQVREHVGSCDACRLELQSYHRLSALMSGAEPTAPPPDLAVRIKVAVAREQAALGWAAPFKRLASRTHLILENILEPLAVPATGGVLTALLVFAMIYHFVGVGMPLGAVPNDLPINLMQPARLESLAPFPVPGPLANEESGLGGPHALLVEATVNAAGEVVNYRILSGPSDLAVRRQIDQMLLFSRFRPQMSFGRPTGGGRVVLSFSEVRVRG